MSLFTVSLTAVLITAESWLSHSFLATGVYKNQLHKLGCSVAIYNPVDTFLVRPIAGANVGRYTIFLLFFYFSNLDSDFLLILSILTVKSIYRIRAVCMRSHYCHLDFSSPSVSHSKENISFHYTRWNIYTNGPASGWMWKLCSPQY